MEIVAHFAKPSPGGFLVQVNAILTEKGCAKLICALDWPQNDF
jgi:hypothetical protein